MNPAAWRYLNDLVDRHWYWSGLGLALIAAIGGASGTPYTSALFVVTFGFLLLYLPRLGDPGVNRAFKSLPIGPAGIMRARLLLVFAGMLMVFPCLAVWGVVFYENAALKDLTMLLGEETAAMLAATCVAAVLLQCLSSAFIKLSRLFRQRPRIGIAMECAGWTASFGLTLRGAFVAFSAYDNLAVALLPAAIMSALLLYADAPRWALSHSEGATQVATSPHRRAAAPAADLRLAGIAGSRRSIVSPRSLAAWMILPLLYVASSELIPSRFRPNFFAPCWFYFMLSTSIANSFDSMRLLRSLPVSSAALALNFIAPTLSRVAGGSIAFMAWKLCHPEAVIAPMLAINVFLLVYCAASYLQIFKMAWDLTPGAIAVIVVFFFSGPPLYATVAMIPAGERLMISFWAAPLLAALAAGTIWCARHGIAERSKPYQFKPKRANA